MGHGERRVDTKELEGVRDLDLGSEAGKEEARVGGREDKRTNDETRQSQCRVSA